MFLELHKGDIIDIIAPSSANYSVSIEAIEEFIVKLGYVPRIRDGLMEKGADTFSANNNDVRFSHLLESLLAKDSKAIWAFRGGYGATRLIPMLEQHDFSLEKKILIGFSDITALFLYFNTKYKWPYLHGKVLNQCLSYNSLDTISIENILSGKWNKFEYKFIPLNALAKENKVINTEIVGGNLSLIQCSLGTNWQINSNNKILFIEETNERGYSIHRMLEHLNQAGAFKNIKALLIGDIDCKKEPNGEFLCNKAIVNYFKYIDFPVIKSTGFGHGKNNYPLLMGTKMTLILGNTSCITFRNN